jgi:2-haloacid dehalogenase
MSAGDPRVVIFDLGGVLVDWNPRYLYRKLFTDPAEMERFLAEVCTTAWNLRQDAGRPFAEAVAELIAQHPAQAEMIRAYHERWPETLGEEIADSVAILGELKAAGRRLYALTNWSHETFPIARTRFAFLTWFDGIVVSGEERMIKPDPRLFGTLLARHHVDPTQAVFIDDNAANVEAAVALGMHGIEFRSPAQLRAALAAVGLVG